MTLLHTLSYMSLSISPYLISTPSIVHSLSQIDPLFTILDSQIQRTLHVLKPLLPSPKCIRVISLFCLLCVLSDIILASLPFSSTFIIVVHTLHNIFTELSHPTQDKRKGSGDELSSSCKTMNEQQTEAVRLQLASLIYRKASEHRV